MIEIIRPAPSKYKCTCSRCGCYFSYELEDLRKTIVGIDEGVYCPKCQKFCEHQAITPEMFERITNNTSLTI